MSVKKIVFLVLVVFSSVGFGKDCFPQRNDFDLVYDESHVLSEQERLSLNKLLVQTSNETSNQIVIVIVNTLCGMDKAMYATDLGHEWGVGRANEDNGIVILVKPVKDDTPRTTFIAVGYGLEGVIPDATAKLIVENEMNPRFKEGLFYEGLKAGLEVIIPLVKSEFDYVAYNDQHGQKSRSIPWFLIVLVIIVLVSRMRGARSSGGSFWTAFMLGNLLGGGGRRGGPWDDFRSGGGGFGGFGGGGFGGGGAGGDW